LRRNVVPLFALTARGVWYAKFPGDVAGKPCWAMAHTCRDDRLRRRRCDKSATASFNEYSLHLPVVFSAALAPMETTEAAPQFVVLRHGRRPSSV
jgi:hypothetical protein